MTRSSLGLLKNRNVVAWVTMISALAMHVFDEAVTGFLPFYNEQVLDLQERLGFFPMPTFSFDTWLGGLVLFVLVCFALTPVVVRGGMIMRIVVTALGVLMTLNASAHVIGSFYSGRLLPGCSSSPLLLFAAVWVVSRGLDGRSWVPTHTGI